MSREIGPLILSYYHLRDFPRQEEALHLLKKLASMVKPIMRARGWRVGQLSEMYPSRADLLGLNVDRGREIKVRLRQHWDRSQFLPFEEILDTMLHELVHIVHGPHDDKFNALWDQLRDEMEGLMMKGYTGDGFLSQGRRLGGRSIPYDEIRRLARAEAERNKPKPSQGYGGHRLGGSRPPPGQDIRNVILESIERRNRAEKGCGSQNRSEREIQEISESWKQNGFRTKAEEDEANEAAIAQALWELVQEDEKRKYGSSYIPPSAQNPFGNGGGAFLGYDNAGYGTGVTGSRAAYPAMPTTTRPPPPTRPKSPVKNYWACSLCTLHNPLHAEKCDACGVSAPRGPSRSAVGTEGLASDTRREVIDLTDSPPKKKPTSGPRTSRPGTRSEPIPAAKPAPAFWECSLCNNVMEREWWTCSICGKMKESS